MKESVFLIAGGDLRQLYLARLLSRVHTVYVIGFDQKMIEDYQEYLLRCHCVNDLSQMPQRVDYIVLPMPAMTDDALIAAPMCAKPLFLSDVLLKADPDTVVLGGKVSERLQRACADCGSDLIDYLDREELAVLNAVPTAEGALQIAMEETPMTLYGQKVLVTGFGRIGKVLARLLQALGCHVTIAARKCADFAWIDIYGYDRCRICDLESNAHVFDLIFNTVPHPIFDKQILSKLKRECLLIDLASKPGGVDFNIANRLGIKTIWALSLPGKVAPFTSGEIIYNTICNIVSERSE